MTVRYTGFDPFAPGPHRRRVNIRRVLILFACVALSATVYTTGVLDVLTEPERLRSLAVENESAFAAAYVLVLTVVSALGIPGIIFMVPAPLVFAKWTAFWLGLVGGVLGSYLSYALARYVLRDYATEKFGTRFASWNERLEKNAFVAVLSMRLMFFLLPPVSFAIGLTKVRTLPFLLGTTLGALPWIAFISFVGGSFLDWLAIQPAWVYALLVSGAGAGAALLSVRDRVAAFAGRVLESRTSSVTE
jgi:uncharacterized membrane protein YdjX (TVP38/TMEM64 family)